MSLPRTSSSYPSAFLDAVKTAFSQGSLEIPCANPLAMRLQFQGLRGALRRENAAEIIDAVSFHIQKEPPALVIRARDNTSDALAVSAALSLAGKSPTSPPPVSTLDAESALDRILGRV